MLATQASTAFLLLESVKDRIIAVKYEQNVNKRCGEMPEMPGMTPF